MVLTLFVVYLKIIVYFFPLRMLIPSLFYDAMNLYPGNAINNSEHEKNLPLLYYNTLLCF